MKNQQALEPPAGWRTVAFGDCADIINGRAYAQDELLDQGTPVLRIQNLNGGDR
jgi:type I restriction enzyme S subunit